MNLPSFYRFLKLRVFVLRIGSTNQNPVFHIAYAVAEPFSVTKALPVSVREFKKIDLSLSYSRQSSAEKIVKRCFVAVITIVDRPDVICDIIAGLINGHSLADACSKWGIKPPQESDLNFYFSREVSEVPLGIVADFPGDITFSHTWRLQDPASLLTYGSIKPSDPVNGITSIARFIAESLGADTRIMARRVGNIEILFRPACDASGHSLVTHSNQDDGKTHIVTIRKELYDGEDEVIVNMRLTDDDRILTDEVHYQKVGKGAEMEFSFSSPERPGRTDVKIWLRKGEECRLVHRATMSIIKRFNINMQIVSNRIQLSSDWHSKIRNAMPDKKRGAVDDAAKITRVSNNSFSVGNVGITHDKEQCPRRRTKPDDAFFPKGWNPGEDKDGVHGALEFLQWFRERTEGASDIMLQDPYFEDVALLFIASSESHARYTVITQTGLKTNPDGTSYVDDSSDTRADKILMMIQQYPTLFAEMQLVVKNLTGNSNKLHDRYLILSYPDGHTEGYILSNSLQGATTKQPLLVTRIGDDALEKLMAYIGSNIMKGGLTTLYDSEEAIARSLSTKHSREVADRAFMDWVRTAFSLRRFQSHPEDCIRLIFDDIQHGPFSHSGAIPAKISTLGNMLASTKMELVYRITAAAVGIVRDSPEWISIFKDFILCSHDAEFPVGFRNCPNRGRLNLDLACLADMDYIEVLSKSRMYLVEYSCCERDYFSTWGQHFVCGILVEGAPVAAADALMKLRAKVQGYHGDRMIYPAYLAANMLLHEMFSLVVFGKGDFMMRTLLSHDDKWLRGIGALMLLYCATDKDFKLDDYTGLIALSDEIMAVAHRALYLRHDEVDKDAFYKWILATARSDKDVRGYAMTEGVAFLKNMYSLEERVEYVTEVLVPLTSEGILDTEDVGIKLTDALYDPTQQSKSMTELLPFVLEKTGAPITYLKTRLDDTIKECGIEEGRLLLKDENSTFGIETKRRNIAPLLAKLNRQ